MVLEILLLIVTALSLGAILLPLAIVGRVRQGQSTPLMLYFGAIGLAFMLIEIGQLERLTLFLGHPIYGLSVVLFVLLGSSSLGSWCSGKLRSWLWMLPVVLGALIWLGPWATGEFAAASRLSASASPCRCCFLLDSSWEWLFPSECNRLVPIGLPQPHGTRGSTARFR